MPYSASVRRSSANQIATIALAMLCIAQTSPGSAAKVYRCGNTFQDQPCPEAKAAEPRASERTAVPRDTAPCGAIAKDPNGRSDCAMRTASRETRAPGSAETRR